MDRDPLISGNQGIDQIDADIGSMGIPEPRRCDPRQQMASPPTHITGSLLGRTLFAGDRN
jgi:hypothetical protein